MPTFKNFVPTALAGLLAAAGCVMAQTPVPTTGGATSGERVAQPPAGAAAQDPQVIRGEYLARSGDCISCHTRPQGVPFAGGLSMATPFGTIISTLPRGSVGGRRAATA